ncbi:MAG TPA: hypothetical protein VGL39_27835 [Jatrophihabitantaceae bacterium]
MYEALSVLTYVFAIDAVEDLSSDLLKFALDKNVLPAGGGAAGTHVVPGADPLLDTWLAGLTPKAPKNMTRYWWTLLLGAGQPVSPQQGTSLLYGRLVDAPNLPIFDWRITLRN